MNPRFNLAEWANMFSRENLLPEDGLAVVNLPSIVGPRDVCKIALCRKLMEAEVKWGKTEYIDYFIWAQGEGSVIGATRMGGRPELPGPEHWPRGVGGEFLPFIGQINFSDSRDIVDVPQDVVSIFARLVDGCVEEHKLLWFDPDDISRLDPGRIPPTTFHIAPHHGYVCRLATFPDAAPLIAPQDGYVRIQGNKLYYFGDLCIPGGTCIGGYSCGERYHAIINWLRPTPNVIYPYLNRKEPYSSQECTQERSKANAKRLALMCEYASQPSKFGGILPKLHEYPTPLFEFADCGCLLLLRARDGSFELHAASH